LTVDNKNEEKLGVQHIGIGKSLIRLAEEIARKNFAIEMTAYPAPGVIEYFTALGYAKGKGYSVKKALDRRMEESTHCTSDRLPWVLGV
jgi:histone acetyltransferase (RNA polymerase elongator complex component)